MALPRFSLLDYTKRQKFQTASYVAFEHTRALSTSTSLGPIVETCEYVFGAITFKTLYL
jgi:hypothetical protein